MPARTRGNAHSIWHILVRCFTYTVASVRQKRSKQGCLDKYLWLSRQSTDPRTTVACARCEATRGRARGNCCVCLPASIDKWCQDMFGMCLRNRGGILRRGSPSIPAPACFTSIPYNVHRSRLSDIVNPPARTCRPHRRCQPRGLLRRWRHGQAGTGTAALASTATPTARQAPCRDHSRCTRS